MPHNFADWEVVVTATATTDGRYERSCVDCHLIEYKRIPAYGNKDIANIETPEVENGKVVINEEQVNNVLKEIEETNKKEVTVSTNSDKLLTNVEMSSSTIQKILDSDCSLTIKTTEISATFDTVALSSIMTSASAENIEFNLQTIDNNKLNESQKKSIKDSNIVSIISAQILCGDDTISNFGNGKVQLRIPFAVPEGKSADNYKIIYIADDGTVEDVTTSYTDGALVVELEHFSEYAIVEIADDAKLNTGLMVAIITISAFVLLAGIGLIVFIRKERKR